ncbi:MAG: hypothetical protein H7A24_14425 [Leptospiraceae bacterium]|nr:hypothetical protein [Leptospiraceae bacterium]MCP5513078.1 hypothetical protein [Leptospiraceae bacterium]
MKLLFLIFLVFFSSCSEETEEGLESIDRLIEDEKYDIAKDRLKEKLSSRRKQDEVISRKRPVEPRFLELSNDRNRIVWTEEKTIIFRDLANPLVKTVVFSQVPSNLSISSDAEHAVVSFPLPSGAGCRLVAVSLVEAKESYMSNSYVSCSHHGAINYDGNMIYYFIDDSLYSEKTSEPKTAKLILDKKNFPPPAESIKNRYRIFPIGKTFVIFSGNGGSYKLYWLDPKKNTIELLSEEIATPKIYYGTGKNGYLIVGKIGDLYIQEMKFSAFGKPLLSRKISIGPEETISWPISVPDEFISTDKGTLFLWTVGKKRKRYPILASRFWVAARDQIIYEDKLNDLVLVNLDFSETDWRTLELYKNLTETD